MAVVVAEACDDGDSGGRGSDEGEGGDGLLALLLREWRMESTVGRVVSSSEVSPIGTWESN